MVSTKVYSLLSLLAYCNPSDFKTTSNERNIEDRLEEIVSYLKQTPKYKDLINEWSIVDAQEIPGTGYKAIVCRLGETQQYKLILPIYNKI